MGCPLKKSFCACAASVLAMFSSPVGAAGVPNGTAVALLRQAIEAQGGETALRRISSVRWEAHGYRNMLEQSERPEGPYIPEFETTIETHDQANGRFRSITKSAVYPGFQYSSGVIADSSAAVRLNGQGTSPANATSCALHAKLLRSVRNAFF